VTAGGSKNLTAKVKFAGIGSGLPGASGSLVRLATTTSASQNQARGTQSGTALNIDGSAGTTTGARYFKSLPTLAKQSVSSTALANGSKELYRFSVTADSAGSVGLYKFTFNVATSGATITALKLTEVETGKVVDNNQVVDSNGDVNFVVDSSTYGTAVITVGAGQTRSYKLEGTVAGASDSGDTVNTKLLGDDAYPILASGTMGNTTTLDAQTEDNFIWSPISTTTSAAVANLDWTNGFRVPGIEFDDLNIETLSR